MESEELRFRHVGLSSDNAVIFCAMDNGKNYALPLHALEQAEDWSPKAKPKLVEIIHDGYAAVVQFDTGVRIDFPSDFVLHVCEPSYGWHKEKKPILSGVGGRIREIRQGLGVTLEALAAKCGIAKSNLSRLEHDKVTPTFETLAAVAAALGVQPILLVARTRPEDAWKQTRHVFGEWRMRLRWKRPGSGLKHVPSMQLVNAFLATRPEHTYARKKLLKYAVTAPNGKEALGWPVDAEKWAREEAAAAAAKERGKQAASRRAGSFNPI